MTVAPRRALALYVGALGVAPLALTLIVGFGGPRWPALVALPAFVLALGSATTRIWREKRLDRARIDALAAELAARSAEAETLAREKAELVAAARRAEEANKAKSTFLASMSHDLRTPLTAVLGYAELLRDGHFDEATRTEHARTILRSGRHLLHLLNQVLDSAKVESGAMSVRAVVVELGELIAEIGEQMRVPARERGLAFGVVIETSIPSQIETDPLRLRQILENLLGNAIKFTERGTVELRVALSGGRLVFRVTDTGVGMTPEQATRLFGEYVQVDEVSLRKGVGTGLGLHLSRKLAGLLGGEITFTTRHGVGSTFTLELPARFAAGTPMIRLVRTRRPSQVFVPARNFAGINVLVADDTEATRALVRVFLEHAGATVELARDGSDVLERFSREPLPDLAFVDVQMPNVDGVEAVRQLRARAIPTPIVALTGHATDADRDACLASGFSSWLPKPVTRAEILAALERFAPRAATPEPQRLPLRAPAPMPELRSSAESDPLVARLLGVFYEELSDAMPRLRSTHAEDVAKTAHTLAGAGGSYGFGILTDNARALEQALKGGRGLDAARDELTRLLATCERILASRPPPASEPPLGRMTAGVRR